VRSYGGRCESSCGSRIDPNGPRRRCPRHVPLAGAVPAVLAAAKGNETYSLRVGAFVAAAGSLIVSQLDKLVSVGLNTASGIALFFLAVSLGCCAIVLYIAHFASAASTGESAHGKALEDVLKNEPDPLAAIGDVLHLHSVDAGWPFNSWGAEQPGEDLPARMERIVRLFIRINRTATILVAAQVTTAALAALTFAIALAVR